MPSTGQSIPGCVRSESVAITAHIDYATYSLLVRRHFTLLWHTEVTSSGEFHRPIPVNILAEVTNS